MSDISKATAQRIWNAHREMEVGQKLLEEVDAATKGGAPDTPGHDYGRSRGFQLGIPSKPSCHQLLNVSANLVPHIINAHIANQQKELAEACLCAKMELDGVAPEETDNG